MLLCQGAGVGADGVATALPTIGGFVNGGFDDEEEDICAYTCQLNHEWAPFAGTQCGHKYMEPVGWSASGTAVICNANSGTWGGLVSNDSSDYLVIQHDGGYIEQTVEGLTPGKTYEISFLATHRPCGNNVAGCAGGADTGVFCQTDGISFTLILSF